MKEHIISKENHMKRVLLIERSATSHSRQKAISFASLIQSQLNHAAAVENCEIGELFFELDREKIAIYHPTKSFDLRDFDLVIVRNTHEMLAEANAIAEYCEYYKIKYTDTYLKRWITDKFSTQLSLWCSGTKNWPRTFYGNPKELRRRMGELGETIIMKNNRGSKGMLNFSISTQDDFDRILREHPDTRFMLQEFIPNDGDLRILVFNYRATLVIKRKGTKGSHLNNTSQGGSAEIIPLSDLSMRTLKLAEKTAKLSKLEVAGVDVMFEQGTNREYLLEINNAPQISSGSFTHEKAEKYADMIQELLCL